MDPVSLRRPDFDPSPVPSSPEGGVKRTERRSRVDENGRLVTQRVPATYTVYDRAVIAALVNAVKELSERLDALAASNT
jgi:hypothetical protein